MGTREDLIAARALIDTPEKWARGEEISLRSGRLCAAVACNDFPEPQPMFDALKAALPSPFVERAASLGISAVFDFNDHPSTTHADIMSLFDRAIKAQSLSDMGGGQ